MIAMKRTYLLLCAAIMAAGCSKRSTSTYSDAEYVMFSDSVSLNIIMPEQPSFRVPVASTIACDYDRTLAVEIVDSRSSAIEGRHYTLESNTITIKAGKRVADVVVNVDYQSLENSDTLNFTLQLVMPEQLKWDLYGDRTEVKMLKGCGFSLADFTGWCVVTSSFLMDFPGDNTSIQRLIYTEAHPTEENTVIMRNWLYDGYDVTIRLKSGDASRPLVVMDDEQVLSNEQDVFLQIHGDDKILVTGSPTYTSYFNSCDRYVMLYTYVYVENLGQMVGVVGNGFANVMEWVSDEEADRLEREEGLTKRP